MRFRFAAGVGAVLAIAAGVGAAPPQPQGPRFQPYYAVRTVENQDKFGKVQSSYYSLEERDASGRTLTARLDKPIYGGKLTQATIMDPVKMRRIEINYLAHTATMTQFPPGAADKMMPLTKPFATEDSNRSELGDKTLNELQVHGYTWTVNDPNALADLDAPAVARPAIAPATMYSPAAYPVTYESWWSPVLQAFILTTARDGNGNQQIIHYDQLMLKEPTASDFAIPAGFHVTTVSATGGMR